MSLAEDSQLSSGFAGLRWFKRWAVEIPVTRSTPLHNATSGQLPGSGVIVMNLLIVSSSLLDFELLKVVCIQLIFGFSAELNVVGRTLGQEIGRVSFRFDSAMKQWCSFDQLYHLSRYLCGPLCTFQCLLWLRAQALLGEQHALISPKLIKSRSSHG